MWRPRQSFQQWVELGVLVFLIAMIVFFVVLPNTPLMTSRAYRWSLPEVRDHESHPMPPTAPDRG